LELLADSWELREFAGVNVTILSQARIHDHAMIFGYSGDLPVVDLIRVRLFATGASHARTHSPLLFSSYAIPGRACGNLLMHFRIAA
jgi:hypothetical protein